MASNILEITNLCKNYRRKNILNHLDLELHRGDICGLVGCNGSGKTTLLRLISSLSFPDEGKIFINSPPDKMSKLSGIIEYPAFYKNLSARQNLNYYCIIYGREKSRINYLLEIVGLSDDSKKYKYFSLGMKQRLGLALALLNDPQLILLDEPTNGIDPLGIVQFRDIILNLNKNYGITFLISTHALSELAIIANRIVIIDAGHITRELSSNEIAGQQGNLEQNFVSTVSKEKK